MSLLDIICTDVRKSIGDFDDMNVKIPGLEYDKVKTSFFDPINVVGYQQRAFTLYWLMREYERTKGIGLDIGCGQVISPFCIGADFYSGSNHPEYGGVYRPHVRCLGETLPFKNETFDFIMSLHSLEHMRNTVETIKEWLRVLKKGGKIIVVMPDRKYGPSADRGHAREYTADKFRAILNNISNIRILEHDTFRNHFSFNTLIEKII